MPDRYQPLRDAIAAGPTPGKWRGDRGKMRIKGSPTFYSVRDERGFDVVFWSGFDRYESKSLKARNSRYIAAASPDIIAALLKERDALWEALSELVTCHAGGGFVEPDPSVMDAARAALARLNGDDHA